MGSIIGIKAKLLKKSGTTIPSPTQASFGEKSLPQITWGEIPQLGQNFPQSWNSDKHSYKLFFNTLSFYNTNGTGIAFI